MHRRFKVDFRHTQWMAVSYVLLFFAVTGGMLGVVAHFSSARPRSKGPTSTSLPALRPDTHPRPHRGGRDRHDTSGHLVSQ
jgi:hypothetical protein